MWNAESDMLSTVVVGGTVVQKAAKQPPNNYCLGGLLVAG